MNIYKRGQIYWTKFIIDGKTYRYSCKTKDKTVAEEVASAIHADTIRNRFNIPAKNKAVYTFEEVFKEYIKNSAIAKTTLKSTLSRSKHFLSIFADKNIADITQSDIKNYQLQRKLEIIAMPKNIDKRESEISFKSINH